MAAKRKVRVQSYLLTDQQLAELARDYVTGVDKVSSVSDNYLKALVAHSQRELKAAKTASQESMIGAVTAAHEKLYNVVLAAVVTPDIQQDLDLEAAERSRRAKERNRRSNFARSSKSVLVNWLRAGFKLADLEPGSANKDKMQQQYKEAAPASIEDQLDNAERRIVQLLKQLAEQDVESSRERFREIQEALKKVVEPVRPLTATTRRVKDITLHPH